MLWSAIERVDDDWARVKTGGRGLRDVEGKGAETNIVVMKEDMALRQEDCEG